MAWRTHRLRHEIVGLLLVKLAALTVIYLAFFGPSSQPRITSPSLSAHLLTATTQ